MKTVQLYEQLLGELIELREKLEKEYNYNQKVYQTLKTDSATPDVSFMDFLSESAPDWTKVLCSNIVIEIVRYSINRSEELKEEIVKKMIKRNQDILYKKRALDFELNECPFEIDEKVAECDSKIDELLNQIKTISKRIGRLEAEKTRWLNIKKVL